jgi:signal transduction histidine kinase
VSAVPDPTGWLVTVADEGIGVAPEYADAIFALFGRVHSRADYPGTGMGLPLARRIVEHHGGRIWLDAEAQNGATIRFTLPALPGRG